MCSPLGLLSFRRCSWSHSASLHSEVTLLCGGGGDLVQSSHHNIFCNVCECQSWINKMIARVRIFKTQPASCCCCLNICRYIASFVDVLSKPASCCCCRSDSRRRSSLVAAGGTRPHLHNIIKTMKMMRTMMILMRSRWTTTTTKEILHSPEVGRGPRSFPAAAGGC